jgi:uncharacterized protein (UPF0276 family)
MHGVSLSIGSPDPLRPDYLKDLKTLVDEIEPIIVSDHLCWTRLGAHNSHDLLPLPYTAETLDRVARKVEQVQEFLGRRILLENASMYVAFAGSQMSEPEFLRELCHRTGCGVLLDLNNIFVNQCNLGWDTSEYFELLTPEMVGQFHLAGHMVLPDVRIDTHDHPVPDEVWALYRLAAARWPQAPTLVEWDAELPEFPVLQEECNKARRMRSNPAVFKSDVIQTKPVSPAHAEPLTQVQEKFMSLITTPEGVSEDSSQLSFLSHSAPVSRVRGINVYNQAYYLRIRDCLRDGLPTLAHVLEDDAFDEIVARYITAHPPTADSIKYVGNQIESFLRTVDLGIDFGVPQSVLADLAALGAIGQRAGLPGFDDRYLR